MEKENLKISENEIELIRKAKKGDKLSFTKLVKKYESTVYNFAFKVCRDAEKAEETVQDTFVNVYRKLNQFGGKAKFSTWLYQIVTNNCLMKKRKTNLEKKSISIESVDSYDDNKDITIRNISATNPSPQEELINKELREKLDNAILKLPLNQRLAFILRDVEGKSSEESAKILKITIPALKSRLRKARISLKNQLHEYINV